MKTPNSSKKAKFNIPTMKNSNGCFFIAVMVQDKHMKDKPGCLYVSKSGISSDFIWEFSLEYASAFKSLSEAISFYKQNKDQILHLRGAFNIIKIAIGMQTISLMLKTDEDSYTHTKSACEEEYVNLICNKSITCRLIDFLSLDEIIKARISVNKMIVMEMPIDEPSVE